MVWRSGCLFVVFLLLVGGCATNRFSSFHHLAVTPECAAQLQSWRDRTSDAGTLDAQDWSPPGFSYLRVDRFLASYSFSDLSPDQQREWLQRAHRKAVDAWWLEAQGKGVGHGAQVAELEVCGRAAIERLLDHPELWPELDRAKTVPDSYSTAARVIGLYPLIAPLVRWRAAGVMGEIMARFGGELPPEPWRFYRPAGGLAALEGGVWPRSSLGIPVLTPDQREALFRKYAPVYAIATHSQHDVPGRPGRGLDGRLRFLPEPVVYTQLAWTRWHGEVLPQLVYTLWFSARPADGAVDIYAGAFDGLVWRVTLGSDGTPLVYDVVHPCGCYHQWLPVEGRVSVKAGVGVNREPFWLLPPARPVDGAPTLYLGAGHHQLLAVVFGSSPARAVEYHLRDYRRLRGMSYAGGRLFGGDGLVAGTERQERFLLWPTGVVSAGGMRQWGHHAVAFVGRVHLDDPDLLERYFLPALPATAP